jgi:triacylglycerol lipase
MLARLQQFTTVTLIATALAWASWFSSRPPLAAAGALIILAGYSLFLAVEFMLVGARHGDDPAPKPRAVQLLRAWAGEVWHAPQVFCWRQPFRARAEPDHLLPEAAGRRGVILVHGFVCNRGLWNPWMRRLRQAGVPFAAVNLEPVFGSIDDYPPIVDAAVRAVESATGLAPLIVAHSMGGLAVRAWLDSHLSRSRVHRIVTIASPHRGTWLARFAFVPNARQMQIGGPWIRQLASREPPQLGEGFTCFYGHCDNIVFPASTATLPGADNRHLPATAHVHMVSHPAVWDEVMRWLEPAAHAGPEATPPQA